MILSVGVTSMEKEPSMSVVTPRVLPSMVMVAPGKGLSRLSTTFPFSIFFAGTTVCSLFCPATTFLFEITICRSWIE